MCNELRWAAKPHTATQQQLHNNNNSTTTTTVADAVSLFQTGRDVKGEAGSCLLKESQERVSTSLPHPFRHTDGEQLIS